MDYQLISEELDSIIEEVKAKKIKLSKEDLQIIDEIMVKLDEQKARKVDELRNQDLLNKLGEIVEVTSGNKVISEDSSQKIIEAIQNLKIETPIVNVAAPEVSVAVEKPEIPPLPPINIPETIFPSEMSLRKPSWIENLINLNPVILAIKGLKSAIESIKLDLPRSASDPLSVRLSDGEKFYKSLGGVASSISSILTFKNSANESEAALVDGDGHVQNDVLSSALPDGASTSENQDISNGLLEDIKDNQLNNTQITRIRDSWGDEIGATMIDQMMVAQSTRLSGGVFIGPIPDNNFYIASITANATVTVSGNELDLAVTTDSGSAILAHAQSLARYMGASMNHFRAILRIGDTGKVNNTRQWGCTNGSGRGLISTFTDGFFFQLSGTTFSVVARTGGSDSIVSSGSFNGDVSSFTPGLNYHTYEILYTHKRIEFYIDKILIHTFTETTSAICNTRQFKPFGRNANTGVGSVCHLYGQVITISRWGEPTSQAKTYFQQGLTAGVLLKNGPGAVHLLNISGVINNSVITLYDGLSTSGTVIWSSGAMGAQTIPFGVPLDSSGGTPFEDGLYMTITAANSNCFIKYE